MTASVAAGLSLALSSTAALNWGFFAQHVAAASLPPLGLRRPFQSLRLLFETGRWLAGFAAGLGGWALYVGALRLAPLSLVQATSAGGIGLLALLVRRTTQELRRVELAGVGTAVLGLAALACSLAGQVGAGDRGTPAAVAAWVLASSTVAATLPRTLPGGGGFGAAAGLLYAAGDVATKAAVGGGAEVGFVAAVLACHGLAFVALQLGFQRGGALATAGVATLLTNALPIVAGAVVFAERLPGGLLGALRVAAFAAVVVGAALLTRVSTPLERRSGGVAREPGPERSATELEAG